MDFVILIVLAWLCTSIIGMEGGKWWGFLVFGTGLSFLILPRLKPDLFFRSRSTLRARGFEIAFVAGLLLISFAVWRAAAESAFDDRLNTYIGANDFTSLIREANQGWWSGQKQRAAEALDKAIIRKAKIQSARCVKIGDQPFRRSAEVLVWDTEKDSPHAAQALLNKARIYHHSKGPLTVFLVSGKKSEQVGTYSVSHQPAFREWVDVCAIQFDDVRDSGTPLAYHEVVSLEPAQERQVQEIPEYGDPAPPVADWINVENQKFIDAIRKGDLEKVKAMLKDNPDLVFSKDKSGETPLHWVATKGKKDLAELLLANGADVNADYNGWTPLRCATSYGGKDVAELLRQHGGHE